MSNWILIDDGYYISAAGGDGYVQVATITAAPLSTTIKTGYLYAYDAVNITGSNIWVQVFDATSQPANGAAPYLQLQVNANSQASISKPLPLHRWVFRNGIFIGSSSTPSSYTASVGKTMMLYAYFTV